MLTKILFVLENLWGMILYDNILYEKNFASNLITLITILYMAVRVFSWLKFNQGPSMACSKLLC